jgi:transposase
MRRYELSDEQWAAIRPFLPARNSKGRPARDDRQLLNGMFWVLWSGTPWRDMPERYGPWQTVYDRFRKWRDSGVIERIMQRLQLRLDEEERIDWGLWFVDSTVVRAHHASAGARKKTDRSANPKTTLSAGRVAGSRPSCTWLSTVEAFRSERT